MNVVDVNTRATNPNTQKLDRKERSAGLSSNQLNKEDGTSGTIPQVTAKLLERQVDDLVENFNKLARTLNRPQLHEINSSETMLNKPKGVSCYFSGNE